MKIQEIDIVVFFNKLGNKKLDFWLGFLNSITFLAFLWGILIAIAVLKNPEIAKSFLVAVVLVSALHFGITEGIFKHAFFFKRKRPYVAYPEKIKPVGRKFSDSSFPSSHMATTVAMLFVIVSFYPSLFLIALALVLFMAFSRLHNGMHYPTDLLAGTLLGLVYGAMAMYFVR